VKAVIFDCFGVIWPDVLLATYEHFGGDTEKDAKFIHDTILAANRGLIPNSRSVFAEHFGVTVDEWMAEFEAHSDNDQELLAFIRSLRLKYKTAMLSNVSRGRLPEILTPEELASFDEVVASGDIGYAKPEPEAYEIVADRLGVRLEECIFTDDREEYCDGARAVGMQAILYKNFAQFRTDLEKLLTISS
jgi:FMN phosphatase YigB (HAD superfamily)